MAKADVFTNRIIGYATKPADQFQANPLNYRKHPQRQRDAVNGSLRELGWIAAVVENVRTGNLIDGHERVWQALKNNEDVPYLQVDLTEAEEKLALAIFDPITNMAETDAAILDELLQDVNTGESALQELLTTLAEDAGLYGGDKQGNSENYSRKIEPPIYEPSGEKPSIDELYDDTKTKELVAGIDAAEGLTDKEREFLIAAAQRHTVFNFGKIANYYAHSPASVQSVMEDSALVIIDFGKAIQQGFVQFTHEIAEMAREDGY